jgi:hypothetical protein
MRIRLFFASSSLLFVTACHTQTEGQLHHAQFAWNECLGGCALDDNAMAAAGATADIIITVDAGYKVSGVRSSNPAVANFSFAQPSTLVTVTSGAPGQAQLELVDANGQLVDEATVTVTATAKLVTKQGWTGAAPLILAGTAELFHVTTLDANGKTLIGTGAVHFDLPPPLAKVTAITFGDEIGFSGSAGSATITARTPTATLTQPVTIVDPSALGSLVASVKPGSDMRGTAYDVQVQALAGGGAVYAPDCTWSPADPSVIVQAGGVATLEGPAQSTAHFVLTKPGTFSAACTIGSKTTTVTLTR